jgi:hypothetical protein
MNRTSQFQTAFPVVGIASLTPKSNALRRGLFVIGSPRHHLFSSALENDVEASVPVSILRLHPFHYPFNKTIGGPEKAYNAGDPGLDSPGTGERSRYWHVTNLWTGTDFGGGPGGVAARMDGKKVLVLGVGGGTAFIRIES